MKTLNTYFSLGAVVAIVPLSVFADNVITVKLDVPVTAGIFLNMDGASGPYQIMELSEFCDLNEIDPDACSEDFVFDAYQPISFQTGD